MIVMASGAGRTLGDLQASIEVGDIVIIPPGSHHGFVGAGTAGLWALSIQFEGLGLYEDPEHGRVEFDGEQAGRHLSRSGFDTLLARNETFARDHLQNPIFALVSSGRLVEKRRRDRFLDCVQVWSGHFQRALLLAQP